LGVDGCHLGRGPSKKRDLRPKKKETTKDENPKEGNESPWDKFLHKNKKKTKKKFPKSKQKTDRFQFP